jgi:hypothetical protein
MADGLDDGSVGSALTGVALRMPGDTEDQRFALLLRHIERAEHSIPQRQACAEGGVEMFGVGRVMGLVMRRADENTAEHAAIDDPHTRVLQLDIGMNTTRMRLVSMRAYW